jgi:hypothetical protein
MLHATGVPRIDCGMPPLGMAGSQGSLDKTSNCLELHHLFTFARARNLPNV